MFSRNNEKMEQRVEILEKLFDDMRLEPGSICGPAVAVMAQREDGCWEPETVPLPDELTYFRWDEFQPEIDDVEDEAALLHQMLHFHEQVLNRLPSRYKELVTACLYQNLKEEIADLDQKIMDNLSFFWISAASCEEHDTLFYLKSLDLDRKLSYEPGTVYERTNEE